MKYKVIYAFHDLQEDNRIYQVGEEFNAKGKSEKRILELSSKDNAIGLPLIEKVEEEAAPEEVTEAAPEEVTEAAPKKAPKK